MFTLFGGGSGSDGGTVKPGIVLLQKSGKQQAAGPLGSLNSRESHTYTACFALWLCYYSYYVPPYKNIKCANLLIPRMVLK